MLLEERGGNYSASNSCSDKVQLGCAAPDLLREGLMARAGTFLSSQVCVGEFPEQNGSTRRQGPHFLERFYTPVLI